MTDIFAYLRERSYPGRGILLGVMPDGTDACAYFIMGRSENSRNRVFEKTDDGIRTRAFDESKMVDPSLIIYHPVRQVGDAFVVTNGDQTDTIRDFLKKGETVEAALRTRGFEPDGPNWTPRISGVVRQDGYQLSILKSGDAEGSICSRFFYNFARKPGVGHFISTYEGFGTPLPSFRTEPVTAALPQLKAEELASLLWDALNTDNKVSLYVKVGGKTVIINKHQEV